MTLTLEWYDTTQDTKLQAMRCWECHRYIGVGRIAIVSSPQNPEFVQIFCQRCGERLERESGVKEQ